MELSLDITTYKCDSLNLSFNNNHQGTPPKKPPRKDSAEYYDYYNNTKDAESHDDIIEERPSDMDIFDDIHRDLEEKGMLLSPTRTDFPKVHEVIAVPLSKSDWQEDEPSQSDAMAMAPNTDSSEISIGRPSTPDDLSERKLAVQKSISWLRQELVGSNQFARQLRKL